MPFNFRERPNSRTITEVPPAYMTKWVATGEHNPAIVHAYAIANTPGIVAVSSSILYRQDVKTEPAGYDTYYVEVPYAAQKEENGSVSLSFDTTGGTLHISASKETIAAFGSGSAVADHKQAIGVTGDPTKDPEGADVVIPVLKLTATFKHPLGVITLPQIKNLARWTGKVNSDTFLTFAPGEVLFLGATGSEGTGQPTEVAYHFACQENLTGLSIGGIGSISKLGHHLYWIQYKSAIANNAATRQPKAVYIERVYDVIPLAAALGFGG